MCRFFEFLKKRYFNIFIALLFSFAIKAQSNDTSGLITAILNETDNFNDIIDLIHSLGQSKKHYFHLFDAVPGLNPINPNNDQKLSSSFGKRLHPIEKTTKVHHGIDIATSIGTSVHATANGTVSSFSTSLENGYGRNIVISHDYGFQTKYAHLSLVFVLKVGQVVKKGDIIGMVGSTGKSTGNHLHYEVIKNGIHINPEQSLTFQKMMDKYERWETEKK